MSSRRYGGRGFYFFPIHVRNFYQKEEALKKNVKQKSSTYLTHPSFIQKYYKKLAVNLQVVTDLCWDTSMEVGLGHACTNLVMLLIHFWFFSFILYTCHMTILSLWLANASCGFQSHSIAEFELCLPKYSKLVCISNWI